MSRSAGNALGIYVSIPFCRSKCTYCNFASGVYPVAEHVRYVERVIADLTGARAWAQSVGAELPQRVDTVYLGGGTPSLLAPDLVTRLFAALRAEFDLDANAEITMECAPGQLAAATLEAMAAVGVNRVSLGVQSFVDSEAHASGRLHSRTVVDADLRRLRAAGISNLNIDLIAGLAGQTLDSWEDSLDALLASEIPHASIYMLEVDEDSRLGREMLKGGVRYHAGLVPGEDAIVKMYERAIERLESAGLRQYEISNFAGAGMDSRHNLRYWQRRPYLGVGLDASSMLRDSVMAARASIGQEPGAKRKCGDLPSFSQETQKGWSAAGSVLRATTTENLTMYLTGAGAVEMERLAPERQHEEAWFLGLRTNAGVDVAELRSEFGSILVEPAIRTAQRLAGDGLLIFDGERVRLTARGRLISNEVFQEFLLPEIAEIRHAT
ncbi:MAG: radical SAM family heme chaperone HemW [Terracidiphilus sp.]